MADMGFLFFRFFFLGAPLASGDVRKLRALYGQGLG